MQISPFVSPQYSLIVSLAEQLPPGKKKKWEWVRKALCTIHIQKSTQEEVDVKKSESNYWNRTRRIQAEPLHRLLCASLLPKRISYDGHCCVHGGNIFTYSKIPFYHCVRLLRGEIAQEPLDQFCGRFKALPFKFRPKWLLFLFWLSVLKLLIEKRQLPHPHPRPHLQSEFWQEKKRGVLFLFGQGCCVLVTQYSQQSRLYQCHSLASPSLAYWQWKTVQHSAFSCNREKQVKLNKSPGKMLPKLIFNFSDTFYMQGGIF